MSDTALAKAAAQAGQALKESAQSHKRSREHHRRQAQEQMAALDRLRRECDRLGIELILEDDNKDPGGQSESRHAQ